MTDVELVGASCCWHSPRIKHPLWNPQSLREPMKALQQGPSKPSEKLSCPCEPLRGFGPSGSELRLSRWRSRGWNMLWEEPRVRRQDSIASVILKNAIMQSHDLHAWAALILLCSRWVDNSWSCIKRDQRGYPQKGYP